MNLHNPYLTLEELKRELKIKDTDTSREDALKEAINLGSRWVDRYLTRDFYQRDYTVAALLLDQYDGRDYDDILYAPFRPIAVLTEVSVGGEVWVDGTDYVLKEDYIVSMRGHWRPHRPDRLIALKGFFGYRQPWKVTSVSIGANGAGYTVLDLLTVVGGAGTAAVLKVLTVGLAGEVGTVEIHNAGAYTTEPTYPAAVTGGTGTGATFNLTVAVDTAAVPLGLPGWVNLATRLVAAALSGQDRKEVAGLDGQLIELATTEIPKTVFQILGKQSPVFL